MPVFSCGGMRYQHQWQDLPMSEVPDENQRNLAATIHRAIELGICHIETARGYGSSERQLGYVLPEFPRDQLIVQTKVAPQSDPNEFERQFRDSLARLKLDYVDLLGLHGINTHQLLWWATRPNGCLAVARKLVDEGLVRHVGFSTHGELDLIQDAIHHEGDGGFDYVNLHWYYIFQRNWPAIQAARQQDMGVFIISPVDKGGMLYRPSERFRELCAPWHPIIFNSLFCLARDEVHTLSLGASCPEDFELQIEALDHFSDATTRDQIQSRLDAALAEVGGQTTDHIAGVPEWVGVPGYINIRLGLWLHGLLNAFEMQEYAKMRYNMLGNSSHWFGGRTAADVTQWDLAKTLADHHDPAQVVARLEEVHQRLWEAPQPRLSESDSN